MAAQVVGAIFLLGLQDSEERGFRAFILAGVSGFGFSDVLGVGEVSKITNPFRCDECGVQKQETNHWYLGTFDAGVAMVGTWDSLKAESNDVTHLCGIECAGKFVMKKISEFK